MTKSEQMEIPVQGMDCVECTMHVKEAIADLPGVVSVDVFLASEKAVVQFNPHQVGLVDIHKAVQDAGYSVPEAQVFGNEPLEAEKFTRSLLTLLGVMFGSVLFVIVVGEWLGLFEAITKRIPWPVALVIVLLGGYPVFQGVMRSAFRGQIVAHTLMTLGVVAALAVGEWATAAVVVFFMRLGDYVEQFTAERARRAVKDLTAMAPLTARLEREGVEVQVPIEQVKVGETVIVRPGEVISVDGTVLAGHATVDQAPITGEAIPLEAGPGTEVYAATIVLLGGLQVRVRQVGRDTTFGRVIKLVEEAEAHRAEVQRVADKFSTYFLPVVGAIAALTFLLSRDPLAVAAVLVVACSCAFALATPIAMLASIGAGAKRGLMIKGGRYLELLAQADVLLIDKTGTLTLGKPEIVEHRLMVDGPQVNPKERLTMLQLAASAERYSEHPLAEAVRSAARGLGLTLENPQEFEAIPGMGVRAIVGGHRVEVGSRRLVGESTQADPHLSVVVDELEAQGKTLLFVAVDGSLVGYLAAADTLRPEVPQAIQAIRSLGVQRIELLTGDNPNATSELVERLKKESGEGDLLFRADLLPEDKIEIVRAYQAQGHTVVMVGDGVNDAPALAQADVGIAMGAAGSDLAIEAAHIALMRDDWQLVPEVIQIARRTMRVVRLNIGFTAAYNLVGLSLAAVGVLPPIMAAAAQSLPDLGILVNSSRLLRQ